MKQVSLVLRIVAIVAGLIAIVGWVLTNGKVSEAKEQLDTTSTELAEVREALAATETELAQLKDANSDSNTMIAQAKRESAAAKANFAQARREQSELETQLRQARSRLAELERDNEELKRELVDRPTVASASSQNDSLVRELRDNVASLEQKLRDAQSGQEALETKVASLEKSLTEANSAVERAQRQARTSQQRPATFSQTATAPAQAQATTGTTQAAPTTLRPVEFATLQQSGQQGKILRPVSDGLMILNLGSNHGLAEKQAFSISSDFSPVVHVVAHRVKPTFSVLSVLPDSEEAASAIGTGDMVTLTR